MPKSTAPAVGVVWPDVNGAVSTTITGKHIWQAAAAAVDPKLSTSIQAEKNFRHQYPKHVLALTDLGAASSENALAIATAGLDAVAESFAFVKPDGSRVTMAQAMKTPSTTTKLHTGTVNGEVAVAQSLDIPGNQSRTDGLVLLQELAVRGSCEPDVATSVNTITSMSAAKLKSLLDTHVFVLLGGTSEMGPYLPLVKLGATVVVVSRCNSKLSALVKAARTTAAGPVVFPMNRAATKEDDDNSLSEAAGADVMTQSPELAAWLSTLYPDRTMVIGSYIYLDGEAHVRAVVAMDAVVTAVTSSRGKGRTASMYLGSPATAHHISQAAWNDAQKRFADMPWYTALWSTPLSFKSNARPLIGETAITNGMLVFQGPNYALAKTIQAWRGALMHTAGHIVSFNMAPPCRTYSVQHSAAAKAAIEGMSNFAPNQAFDPPFASAVMAALVLFDLTPQGQNVAKSLVNPNDISIGNGFHGGNVRCAYTSESLGTAAYITGVLGL